MQNEKSTMLGLVNANILALPMPEKFNNLFNENFYLQQCVSGNWDKLKLKCYCLCILLQKKTLLKYTMLGCA